MPTEPQTANPARQEEDFGALLERLYAIQEQMLAYAVRYMGYFKDSMNVMTLFFICHKLYVASAEVLQAPEEDSKKNHVYWTAVHLSFFFFAPRLLSVLLQKNPTSAIPKNIEALPHIERPLNDIYNPAVWQYQADPLCPVQLIQTIPFIFLVHAAWKIAYVPGFTAGQMLSLKVKAIQALVQMAGLKLWGDVHGTKPTPEAINNIKAEIGNIHGVIQGYVNNIDGLEVALVWPPVRHTLPYIKITVSHADNCRQVYVKLRDNFGLGGDNDYQWPVLMDNDAQNPRTILMQPFSCVFNFVPAQARLFGMDMQNLSQNGTTSLVLNRSRPSLFDTEVNLAAPGGPRMQWR